MSQFNGNLCWSVKQQNPTWNQNYMDPLYLSLTQTGKENLFFFIILFFSFFCMEVSVAIWLMRA